MKLELVLLFTYTLFFRYFYFCHEYNPEGWGVASEYILENLDQNQNPCDNFYRFVCGNQLSKLNETTEGKGKTFCGHMCVIINYYT